MTSVARWVEVHRLAVAGREAGIARDVGGRVGGGWLARSRFADVARLAELTLTLGEDARAFYQLGWARDATGDRTAALAAYDQALRLYRAAGDRGNEAATLSNIGARVPRSGRAAAGAGVLRAGAADHAGGRGPGRGGGHAEQHRRRVRRSGRAAAGAGVLRAGAADPAGGRGPGRGGGHAEQHRLYACERSGRWSTAGAAERERAGWTRTTSALPRQRALVRQALPIRGRSGTGPGRRPR